MHAHPKHAIPAAHVNHARAKPFLELCPDSRASIPVVHLTDAYRKRCIKSVTGNRASIASAQSEPRRLYIASYTSPNPICPSPPLFLPLLFLLLASSSLRFVSFRFVSSRFASLRFSSLHTVLLACLKSHLYLLFYLPPSPHGCLEACRWSCPRLWRASSQAT